MPNSTIDWEKSVDFGGIDLLLYYKNIFIHEALSADDGFTNEIDYAIFEIRGAHLPSQYRTSVGFNFHFNLHSFTSACVMLGGNFDDTRSVESTSAYG